MSGAVPSETPSIRVSRSVRPPIGKSAGAPSAAITASASARVVCNEYAEGVADGVVNAGTGQIEFDVPGFLGGSRLIETSARKKAGLGRALARTSGRGGRCSRNTGRRDRCVRCLGCWGGGELPNSWCNALSMRVVSLPPGTQDSAVPLFANRWRRNNPGNCTRIVRSPVVPSPPSTGGEGDALRQASCVRQVPWPDRARAHRRLAPRRLLARARRDRDRPGTAPRPAPATTE